MRHLLALLISAGSALAAVPERWIDLVGWVESRNDPKAVGDGSRARGEMQFWKATWDDCTRQRKARGLPTWGFSYAHDRAVARLYARSWLDHIDERLTKATGRKPSLGEIYAAYNLGLSGYARRGYRLSECPASTRRNASWLNLHAVGH
jgi:hypothetical protein